MKKYSVILGFLSVLFLMGSGDACKAKTNPKDNKDNTEVSEPSSTNSSSNNKFKACNELKDQALCEKKDQIKGKECMWDGSECTDKPDGKLLADFQSKDWNFINDPGTSKSPNPNYKNENFGFDHGEQPGWNAIISAGADKTKTVADKDALKSFRMLQIKFTKNSDVLEFNISREGGGGHSYKNLKYNAQELPDGLIKITPDLNGEKAEGEDTFNIGKTYNQLEWFTKSKWFFDPKTKHLIVILYIPSNKDKKIIENKKELEEAIDNIKNKNYGYFSSSGSDWGGLILTFKTP